MNKHISTIILCLALFSLVFIVFMPYFTSSFLDLRQEKENEAKYQKFLLEQRLKAEAKQKIYLTGKFDPAQRKDFVLIPPQYLIEQMNQNKMYLRQETLSAFLKMAEAANGDKIDLQIASATRNFDYQKDLWEKKWTGFTIVEGKDLSKSIPDGQERFKKRLEYSAAPGISRHHWGTDIDINNANSAYFETTNGKKVYEWLVTNAPSFGFCQTYTIKGQERPTGYNEEKWHWSYLPLSQNFTEEYKRLIKDEDIKGFLGDEYSSQLNLINNYVLGINPDCL